LWVKRDDCTGLAFGGNKIRKIEFYFGAAKAAGADTVLITGAVQSNFARSVAAMAGRMGMDCHIQLEDRVGDVDELYRSGGNVLLDKLLGATIHTYPQGEDEAGADRALGELAARLKAEGRTPYIIPLGIEAAPLGALGYVNAAIELMNQIEALKLPVGRIVVASGSALTHSGLLFGLTALGAGIEVLGVCVRRPAGPQHERMTRRFGDVAALLQLDVPLPDGALQLFDGALAPGYGKLNQATREALSLAARMEGLLLDPVYTGKVLAGLIATVKSGDEQTTIFVHTGGQPALFGYGEQVLA
jgi:D-cysteine desulfhydrase/L-cysteate sulfo-lyase